MRRCLENKSDGSGVTSAGKFHKLVSETGKACLSTALKRGGGLGLGLQW